MAADLLSGLPTCARCHGDLGGNLLHCESCRREIRAEKAREAARRNELSKVRTCKRLGCGKPVRIMSEYCSVKCNKEDGLRTGRRLYLKGAAVEVVRRRKQAGGAK